MRLANQLVAAIFLAVGLGMMQQANEYGLFIPNAGAGPGLLPMLTGGAIAVLAIVVVVNSVRTESKELPGDFIPEHTGRVQLVAIIGAMFAVVVLLEPLGFRLTMFLFFLSLIPLLGGRKWPLTVAVALIGSIGVFWFFQDMLAVPLPLGAFGF